MRKLPALSLLVLACSAQPTVLPGRNLERPSDMSFVCLERNDTTLVLSGRPLVECRPHLNPENKYDPSKGDPAPDLAKRTKGTFGLVPNTARGELAVVDLDANRLVDLDPSQPGYNFEPLGRDPEVISATQDGCMAVTANRGSCDLSLIDTQRLLSRTFLANTPSTGAGPASKIVPVSGDSGPLHVAPQEIAFLPQEATGFPMLANVSGSACSATGRWESGQIVGEWRAVVTFPSCDLVAVVALPSGKIVSSVYVRPEGVVDAGTDPKCPVDCVGGGAPLPPPDAAVTTSLDAPSAADVAAVTAAASMDVATPIDLPVVADGAASDAPSVPDAAGAQDSAPMTMMPPADAGAVVDSGVAGPVPVGPFRIGALAVRPDGSRLYVGGENAAFVTVLEIVNGVLQARSDGGRIPLHEGAVGVTRLRLSVEPFELSPKPAPSDGRLWVGHFLGGGDQHLQFLYAFARDNSVRVLDVGVDPLRNPVEHECDVNLDPQFTPQQACAPEIEDPAKRPPRRAFIQGPGLHLPTIPNPNVPPALARDISFAAVRGGPDVTSGDFGYLVASNSTVYILNVESASLHSSGVAAARSYTPAGNTFRNSNPIEERRWPVVATTPQRDFVATPLPSPTHVSLGTLDGPRIEGPPIFDPNLRYNILAGGLLRAPTWGWFPDPTNTVATQAVYVTWEGALPGADRVRGVALGPTPTATAGVLDDSGNQFCQVGALPGDLVLFTGCLVDTDCSVRDQEVCRQAIPGTPGMCMPAAQAQGDLLTTCARHMGSRRRYEVTYASPTRLELGYKVDELPRPSAVACDPKAKAGDDVCAKIAGFEKFSCQVVRAGETPRCVETCLNKTTGKPDDQNCRRGSVCEDVPGSLVGPLCVEGPKIIPECWKNGATYQVQAGRSFVVEGGATPIPVTTRAEPDPTRPPVDGKSALRCVPEPNRHQFAVNRIPLDAPHCENVKDEDPFNTVTALEGTATPAGPPGTWGNPCLFWAQNTDVGVDCGDPNRIDPTTAELPPSMQRNMPIPCPLADASTPPNLFCGLRPDKTRDPSCHLKAFFQNSQVRFVMTNLETYGGDANTTRFDVLGGFSPDVAIVRDDVQVTAGVRIVTGPTATLLTQLPPEGSPSRFFPYIFVIDQGRTLTSSAVQGQVLRLNPRGNSDLPLFDSNYSGSPFQIQ